MKRTFYRFLIAAISIILLGVGIFLLQKSRHILINLSRYFFLFTSFKVPLVLLLLECATLFFILFKCPKLSTLVRKRFNKKAIFFTVLFFLGVIALSTNRFLIVLFCISPFAFPLIVGLFFVFSKYPNKYINSIKRLVTNSIVLFVSILIAVVSIEIYLHIARPRFLGFGIERIGVFTDFTSRGYLTEGVFKKKKGVFRILAFGDSFAVCLREPGKNYHDFLQRSLDLRYGKEKVEIVNAGMEGTGPGYFFHILGRYGDLISPDAILVSFFTGNDFHEMHFTRNQIGPVSVSRDNKERILGYLRFKNFWLYQILDGRLQGMLEDRRKEQELREGIVREVGSFSKKTFLRMERDRMWICEKDTKDTLEGFWKENSMAISAIRKWCDKRDIRLVIAILPGQFQVDSDLIKEIFNRYNLEDASMDFAYPNKMLADFFKEADIYCVDLLGQLQRAAGLKELYLLRDTHWNEEGNRLAAEIIFPYVEKAIHIPGTEE